MKGDNLLLLYTYSITIQSHTIANTLDSESYMMQVYVGVCVFVYVCVRVHVLSYLTTTM